MTIARQLAARGLVHCDLNEFNLIVEQNTSAVTLIDFPQMISTKHPNAAMYFERDVKGLVKFFTMKLKFDVDEEGLFDFDGACASEAVTRLDTACRASGFDGCAPDKREGRSRPVKAPTEEEEDEDDDLLPASASSSAYSGVSSAASSVTVAAGSLKIEPETKPTLPLLSSS